MRRNEYTHRRRHISNRHLSDKYYYAGEHETATGIRLTQYNEQSLHTKEVRITDTSFSKLSDPDQINWFEVSGLTNADAITRIVKDFGLHNLDAKDILTPQHVVKVEEYKGRMLIVLNSCYYDVNNEMRSEHQLPMSSRSGVMGSLLKSCASYPAFWAPLAESRWVKLP